MGVHDLLPHLPGGGKSNYKHSFMRLGLEGKIVPFDAAGALWQFAAHHPWDYLRGNHIPALTDWAHLLVYLRSFCEWELVVCMDGSENVHKTPEIERRAKKAQEAEEHHSPIGQIKNTPEYIQKACHVCKSLNIKYIVSAYEADPQVVYKSIATSSIPVTGDSDLLVYGKSDGKEETKIVIVKSYNSQWHRVIDLGADVLEGKYPLLDFYKKYGRITFQLYAGCTGCDFTIHSSGISGIGYETFIKLVRTIGDGELSSTTLAEIIWKEKESTVRKAGFTSQDDVRQHLQNIVDVYSSGKVYDKDSNIIDMTSGEIITAATSQSQQHMAGEVDTKSRLPLSEKLQTELDNTDYSQFIHQTAAVASTIRGVKLPEGKTEDTSTVSDLSDYVAARGGTITLKKPELVKAAKCYTFLEGEVPKKYVDRHPDPNGSLYAKFDVSGTRSMGETLTELVQHHQVLKDDNYTLILQAQQLYQAGMFEEKHDNIARTAPELPESFLYKEFGHIGMSTHEKNIGDALRRCFYQTEATYHAITFVPDTDKVIVLSKARASMRTDPKTKNKTPDGEAPLKQEYLVIMELQYKSTEDMDDIKHDLGIFVSLVRHYCGQCVAGQSCCRHLSERLWYQYHVWTPERFGIDRPSTIDACGWAHGGRTLNCGVRQKIYEQQAVKYMSTLKEQEAKQKRGAKRNCTEGFDCNYKVHRGSAKQNHSSKRFSKERPAVKLFLELLRK